jgi:hypothetical protein
MTPLCRTFQDIGHRTSCDLRHAWDANLSFGEETITETLLLDLKRRHPTSVMLKSFNKHDEAQNGADWEWWFIDSRVSQGFPMRVQAKRLAKNATTFRDLLTYQAGCAPQPQIDMLISEAALENMVPIHCFYLEQNVLTRPSWTSYHKYLTSGRERGCWVGLSALISQKGSANLRGLQTLLFPWHLLVCPGNAAKGANLPQRVRQTLIQISADSTPQAEVGSFPIPAVQEGLPDYVTRLMHSRSVDAQDEVLLQKKVQRLVLVVDNGEPT